MSPNVVLLTVDALRADHLSCYGYDRQTTPNFDEFAEECVRFEHAFSPSSHTREALPALLTGRYPDDALDGRYRLEADSIATLLAGEGYATAGFHSNPFVSRAYGFDAGFDTFDDDLHLGRHRLLALFQRAIDKLRNRHYARGEEITDRSLAWLDSLDGEPFFLWNHYMDPHGPYEPPDAYRKQFHPDPVPDREAQRLYKRAIRDPASITDDERGRLIDLYDAEIRYTDDHVGRFLDALEGRGLGSETTVILTADHGDAFGEHGYYGHPRYLHRELVHVPVLFRPAEDGEGTVVDAAVSTLDVANTCVPGGVGDDAGRPLPHSEADADAERVVFSHASGEKADEGLKRFSGRTAEACCLVEYDTETEAVTSVEGDRSLEQVLRDHVEERAGEATARRESGHDEEIERRLSALGYTE